MKKKIIISIVSVIVLVAVAALIVFIVSGGDLGKKSVDLNGTWIVTSNVNEGVVSIPQNEYMVFDEESVKDFRDGNNTPFATSKYEVNGDVLNLSDISRTYHIDIHTNSYISLYTNDRTFMTIVKIEDDSYLNKNFAANTLSGKWNVLYRTSDQVISNEYLVFENGKMQNFRNNSDKASMESDYQCNGNALELQSIGLKFIGFNVSDDTIALVDTKDGYVWLLQRAA